MNYYDNSYSYDLWYPRFVSVVYICRLLGQSYDESSCPKNSYEYSLSFQYSYEYRYDHNRNGCSMKISS
eukprot:scaffold306975_cov20-Prasinocladus_malaysianus.AAC.1